MRELDVAIKAAKESGKILMKGWNKDNKIFTKKDKSPYTNVDRESESEIFQIIKTQFPEHDFLGEEWLYPKTGSRYKWIIDPLDGTRNFIRKMPFFGNSVALEKDGKIIVGVIDMPALNLFAYASKDSGAYINGKKIKVSETKKINHAFLSFGSIEKYGKPFHNLINSCDSHRGYGDTLMFLLLAQGKVDIVLDCVQPWDIAAAKIIIEEAGGKMTDFNGNETIYSDTTLATNGKLHNKVLEILRK